MAGLSVRVSAKVAFIAACIEEDMRHHYTHHGGGGNFAFFFARGVGGMRPDLNDSLLRRVR